MIALALAVLWLRPIGSSFWLDELGTYWVIRDGLGDTLRLAWRYQGQSPLYYVIAWVARVLGGDGEIVLRLPSVAAATGAVLLQARLGRRLFGRGGGWTSAVAFAATPIVAFSAVDARPYAFAYLALIASSLALTRLMDDGGPRWGLVYGSLTALTVYFHYLFAFALLGHIPYVVRRWRAANPAAKRGLAVAIVAGATLLTPLAGQLRILSRHAEIPGLPLGSPSVGTVFEGLVPASLAVGAVLGWLVARASQPVEGRTPTGGPGSLTLCASLWLAPSVGLLLFSILSGVNLLWQTYTRSSVVGLALLFGGWLGSLQPPRARYQVTMVLVIVSLLSWGRPWHSEQDWRGAMAAVDGLVEDAGTPVLLHAAFIEGADPALLRDPQYRSLLLAPVARYPVRGSIVAVPYNLTPRTEDYLERVVVPAVEHANAFALVTLEPIAPFQAWLSARLEPLGFESRSVRDYGSVRVSWFEKTSRP